MENRSSVSNILVFNIPISTYRKEHEYREGFERINDKNEFGLKQYSAENQKTKIDIYDVCTLQFNRFTIYTCHFSDFHFSSKSQKLKIDN